MSLWVPLPYDRIYTLDILKAMNLHNEENLKKKRKNNFHHVLHRHNYTALKVIRRSVGINDRRTFYIFDGK